MSALVLHLAQDFGIAPRIEGERPLDDLIKGFRVGAAVHKITDAARPWAPDLRAGIDQNQMRELLRVVDRKGERIDGAHGHADEDKAVEAEFIGKTSDILALRRDRIVGVGRPVAVAVAALVEGDAMKLLAQCETAQIPSVSGQRAAMQSNGEKARS